MKSKLYYFSHCSHGKAFAQDKKLMSPWSRGRIRQRMVYDLTAYGSSTKAYPVGLVRTEPQCRAGYC